MTELIRGISTEEAAAQLGYSAYRLRELIREGKINPDKFDHWKGYVFDPNISRADITTRGYNRTAG